MVGRETADASRFPNFGRHPKMSVRRPGKSSFWVSQKQYEMLFECRKDPLVLTLLNGLAECCSGGDAQQIMLDTIYQLSHANRRLTKISTKALELHATPQDILDEAL